MRPQHVHHGRPLGFPARALVLIASGAIVLVSVHGAGAIIIGFAIIAFGVSNILEHVRRPAERPAPESSPFAEPHPLLSEKIVRERHIRERYRAS